MSQSECYPEKAPDVDTLFDTLSHNIRREVINYFENTSESASASIDTIVSHILKRVPEVTSDGVTVSLVHIHLPKLQSRGWLDYDTRSDQIRYYGHESAEQLLHDVADVFNEHDSAEVQPDADE